MRTRLTRNTTSKAFTIVELLIVIVVIGILAAITIVAYNGIQSRARIAGLQSTLAAAAKTIENTRTTAGTATYPSTVSDLDSSITYANPSPSLGGFCALKTDTGITYMVTASNKTPHSGPGCTLVNYVTNPTFEGNAVTGWSTGGNSTIAPTPGAGFTGTYGMTITHTNTTSGNTYGSTCMTGLTVGTQYSISFALRSAVGTPTVTVSLKNTNVGGSIPADSTSQVFIPPAAYSRTVMNWTAEATTTCFTIDIMGTVSSQAVTLDSVMATAGQNANAYVDPLTAPSIWTWATANNSTSTGPAF